MSEKPFGDAQPAQLGVFVNWLGAKDEEKEGRKNIEIGGKLKGTLIEVNEFESKMPGNLGEMQKVYTVKDEEGNEYRVGTRGKVFDSKMSKIALGQKVGLHYAEEIPAKTKGYNPFKNIEVYPLEMDDDYKDVVQETSDMFAD